MAETNPYPGSSSLSPEAREKVLQTFEHTLELARGGRNEEALLGCDFILKMDFRFAPARLLLDSLRGVSSGTVVDVAPFENVVAPAPAARPPAKPELPEPPGVPADLSFGSAFPADAPPDLFAAPPAVTSSPFDDFAPAPPTPAPLAPAPPVFAPQTLPPQAPPPPVFVPEPPASPAAPAFPSALDTFGFDAFDSANPFDAGSTQAVRAPGAALPAPAVPPSLDHDPFGLPPVDPFATPPAIPGLHGSKMPPAPAPPQPRGPERPDASFFDAPLGDPFAGLGPSDEEATIAGFTGRAAPGSDTPFPAEEPSAPPTRPQPAAALPAAASMPAATTDPRVLQFLKQGDDAMARGQIQEAIDLWSRVFLIDLSNDDASRRIDAAREKQAQTAQAIDVLLSEGIQLFDARDLLSARSKFLDVLALSESEPTARNYLNQIESALAQSESAAAPARGSGSDFLGDLSPAPSYQEAGGGSFFEPSSGASPLQESPLGPDSFALAPEDGAEATPPRKTIKLDLRVVGAVVLAVAALAGGGIFLATRKTAPPPGPAPRPTAAQKVPGEDLIAKAQGLFNQGKADEALQILVSIPDRDPRHREALALIDKFKSSAVPGPAPAAPSAASIDEMRVTGFAAMSANRYIEAVKALDPVVKARPDDTEAAQALMRAREHLAALASAVRSYNEQDYESAIKLLWDLRKKDMKNQDVEEFLFKSYFNEGVQDLQAGNSKKAATSFQEAVALRPSDTEAVRHLKFSRKYSQGATDILSRIYVKNAVPRP